MARDDRAPRQDNLLVARLDGTARRHARWGDLTAEEKAAGAADLRELAGQRGDLLAQVAGVAGAAGGQGQEYETRALAIAALCRMAGADEALIPDWAAEGKRRVQQRRHAALQPAAPAAATANGTVGARP